MQLKLSTWTWGNFITHLIAAISVTGKKKVYTKPSLSDYRREGIRSCFAVTESGKRLWYVGRGTYAAVIILPKKNKKNPSYSLLKLAKAHKILHTPANQRPWSAFTVAIAAGIEGHFTYTLPCNKGQEVNRFNLIPTLGWTVQINARQIFLDLLESSCQHKCEQRRHVCCTLQWHHLGSQ